MKLLYAKLIVILCAVMPALQVLQACRSLPLSLVTSEIRRWSSASISTSYGSSGKSFSIIKSNSTTTSTSPGDIAGKLMSLMGGEAESASVEGCLAQQILSCLRFLVPPSPAIDNLPGVIRDVITPRHKSIESLIHRPPSAVADLARKAVEWNGDASIILNALSNESFQVPDIEGASANHCQLTKYTQGHRFVNKELNRYLAFLFEAIAALSPYIGFNVSLNRFDLFHGHLFLAERTGRLGILFHAREYPAFNNDTFPVHLGFCQVGSSVVYDETMNLRNILWLAPMPNSSKKDITTKWVAEGALFILDAHPKGIIYKNLIPDYVDLVRTAYEDDFGTVIVDVNYFRTLNSTPEERIFVC